MDTDKNKCIYGIKFFFVNVTNAYYIYGGGEGQATTKLSADEQCHNGSISSSRLANKSRENDWLIDWLINWSIALTFACGQWCASLWSLSVHCTADTLLQTTQHHWSVTGVKRLDHITPVISQLHWLSVHQQVQFKIACVVHQSLSGHTLAYLAVNIQLIGERGPQNLCSASDRTCFVPCTHKTFSDRSLSVTGPRVWNSLPADLQLETQFSTFKQQLETILFTRSRLWHITTSFSGVPYKYSYLLTYLLAHIHNLCYYDTFNGLDTEQ